MLDFHSHILPGMDDGSRSVPESAAMLEMLASQGITAVAATPHFYANDESVEAFLQRRGKSFEKLAEQLPEGHPKILKGAEVRYYAGISRLNDLDLLKIEDSRLLLLEMPVAKWTEYTLRELEELSGGGKIRVLLAHFERYFSLQKRTVWERLREDGILLQSNAAYFVSRFSRKKALSALKSGGIHVLGSDCHNTASRAPKIGKAYDVIRAKFGDEYVSQMNDYGYSLLSAIDK